MSEKKLRNPVGYTDLIGASGISKSDLRIQVNGAIDEASAVLSLAKGFLPDAYWQDKLTICQQDLSKMMGFTAESARERSYRQARTCSRKNLSGLKLCLMI